ncbi:LemA family protein [Agarivorans sp. MS3-6]|uniref:LemA family protein n=1 Tax=Agarivorans sp. TSD2052 TaxID=2937286 RepID=UPI00200E8F84|nr:LemA family protein [Agarivorans sp. TSD2052]UPW19583.1 LemA family protein [Agarivorans sp. TSD2052]
MDVSLIVILVIIAATIFYVVGIYNRLVSLRNRYQNAFAQIEVQLKRRYDLIPNLVETAKAYMSHEKETLEAVISARNDASALLRAAAKDPSGATLSKLASAEGLLQGAMSKMNIVMESYPDLKASDNMMQLTEELTTTENRVAFSRQAFNDSVTEYNEYRQSFPPVFFAAQFGHKKDANLLEFADSAEIQSAPKVSF